MIQKSLNEKRVMEISYCKRRPKYGPLFFRAIVVCLFLFISIDLSAQSINDKISVEFKNESLASALKKIEKVTKFKVLFRYDDVQWYKVNISAHKETVYQVINLMLKSTPLKYAVKGKFITVSKNIESSKKVIGRVVDTKGLGLSGVNIQFANKRNSGTISGGDGSFALSAENGDVLKFSYIGYIVQTVVVNDQSYLNITLPESSIKLDNVEVLSNGYQKLDKTVATGSYELITDKDIESSPSVNLVERLQGKVPGVRFDVANNKVEIRGANSFYSTSTPLIVIDGFPAIDQSLANYPGTSLSLTSGDTNNAILSSFNMVDIKSITFLKDAAASAIWGSKAANGVIVIETKKGSERKGPATINYNMTLSISNPADLNHLNAMNSSQYIDLEKELFDNNYFTDPTTYWRYANVSEAQQDMFSAQRGEITDSERDATLKTLGEKNNYSQIRKYLLQRAVTQQHNISLSGNTSNGSYYISANYTDNTPVFRSNNSNTYAFTANVTSDYLDKKLSVSIGLNQTFTNTKVNNAALAAISPGTYGLRPYDMLVDSNGKSIDRAIDFTPSVIDNFESEGYLSWYYNPIKELKYSNTKYDKNASRLNAQILMKPLDWLSISLSGIYQKATTDKSLLNEQDSYAARELINTGTTIKNGTITYGVPLGGIYYTSNETTSDQSLRGQIDIDKTWNRINHLQFLAGSEIRQTLGRGYNQTRYGYDEDTQTSSAWNPTVAYTTIYGYTTTLGYSDGTIGATKERYLSYYSNGYYSYMGKYYISGSARFDDYSMIGVDRSKRAKPLWSAGFKWNATGEKFISKINWLSNLDFRLTYGTGGTVPSVATSYPLIYISSKDYYTNLKYASISTPGNQELGWETTRTINEGIDASLFRSRLNLTLELYQKKSYGLLATVPYNSTYGWSSLEFNTGNMKEHGWELNISGSFIRSRDITWSAAMNISYNTNKVTDNRFPNTSTVASSSSVITTGYPVDNMFLYRWAGLDSNGQSQIYNAAGEKLSSTSYATLTADDRYYAGRKTPSYFGGLSQSFRYKNFTLSMYASFEMGYKVLKNDISMSYYPTSSQYSGFLATSKALVNRWRKAGDELKTNIPGIVNSNFNSINWYLLSDVDLISGDNIRMNQISLSYSLPESILQKIKIIRSLSLGATIGNLGLLWTKNKDHIDPDYIFQGTYTSLAPSKNYFFNLNVIF